MRSHLHQAFFLSACISTLLVVGVPALAQTPAASTPAATSPNATESTEQAEPQQTPFRPISPRPTVPIPGVTFTPAVENNGLIEIPYLAQYISGIYRLSVGLGAILAAIMLVYGGFRYMLAASLSGVQDGKTIIQDALIGLVVLLSSYLILKTINPALVVMNPIRVSRIREEAALSQTGEFTGNPAETGITGTTETSACGGGASGRTETFDGVQFSVLPLRQRYIQGRAPWGAIGYGQNLIDNTSMNPCQRTQGSREPRINGCQQSFGNGGCGATAFATIMAYYGVRVSDPGSATLATNTRLWNGDQLVTIAEHPRGQAIATALQARTQPHLFDPIDGGRLAVQQGKAGTGGLAATSGVLHMEGFQITSVSGNPTRAAQMIRSGHPLFFACNHCNMKQNSLRDPDHVGGSHYMVIHGVSQDNQWFLIHDVGGGGTAGGKFISAQEVQNGHVSLTAIVPSTASTQPCNTTTETNPQTANGTNPRTPTPTVSGETTHFLFPFRPASAGSDGGWSDNAAVMLPTRLMSAYGSGGSRPRARLYIYLHGQNGAGSTSAAALRSGTLHDMEATLGRFAGTKNIIIAAPRYITPSGASYFYRFNLGEFYRSTIAALRAQIPGFQESDLLDVVVSGHSSATCQGPGDPLLRQAISTDFGSTRLRGIVGYDGCLGDAVKPDTFSPRTNISIYMNPDLGRNGMGIHGNGDGSGGHPERYKNVRNRWGLRRIACPSYVQNECPEGAPVEPSAPDYNQRRCNACYGKTENGTETISFETAFGHNESVRSMTEYMFRAFYGN